MTAIQNLEVREPLGRGFQFADGLFLTNDRSVIQNLVGSELREAMGSLEVDHLVGRGLALYAKGDLEDEVEPEEAVRSFLDYAHTIFTCLWLVKDNAVTNELAFFQARVGPEGFTWSSNFKARLYCTARGAEATTVFSLEELRDGRRWFSEYLKPLSLPTEDPGYSAEAGIGSRAVPRVLRFLFFLFAARSESDLGVKVASYITCLEIVFSTSPAEIVHKIAERAAVTLADSTAHRLDIFSFVKRAYGVRSRIVHGATLSIERARELPDIAERLDALVRGAAVLFLSDSTHRAALEASTEVLEDFYVSRLLGTPRSGG